MTAELKAARPPLPADLRPLVRLRNLSKSFGNVAAVKPLDLDIEHGDFFGILGPSGCGKTTLLRTIGGFLTPNSGTIEIDGVDVTRLGPEKRPTNMVFQGYGLFPHMSVRQNIAYGLRIARRPRSEIADRVGEIISLTRLDELADRATNELSGGQQQRVALARALIMKPLVLLLDEPLGALDLKLRKSMQEELRLIHDQIGGTFVFVTHDQGEAMALANRIAVMDGGALVQVGRPEEIYARPRNRFVADFIGDANMLTGRRAEGLVRLDAGASFPDPGDDGAVIVVVRPSAISLGSEGTGLEAEVKLSGRLEQVVFLGPMIDYRIVLENGQELTVQSPEARLRRSLESGARVQLGWSMADQCVLDDGAE